MYGQFMISCLLFDGSDWEASIDINSCSCSSHASPVVTGEAPSPSPYSINATSMEALKHQISLMCSTNSSLPQSQVSSSQFKCGLVSHIDQWPFSNHVYISIVPTHRPLKASLVLIFYIFDLPRLEHRGSSKEGPWTFAPLHNRHKKENNTNNL